MCLYSRGGGVMVKMGGVGVLGGVRWGSVFELMWGCGVGVGNIDEGTGPI